MDEPLVHGRAVRLTDRVRRITAPNAGVMTGAGTNTYLLGNEQVTVVDPGPAVPEHVDAILKACDGKLKWILVTHTHRDHSPAAKMLADATGARLMGNLLAEDDGYQDQSFTTDHQFQHEERFVTDEFSLRVLCTPGHVDNHLCYFVEDDGLLLTGDHIMEGSTVVIIPPHGDMYDYMQSLQLLLDYPLRALGPGHGHIIDSPVEEIKGIIQHRLQRESKVINVLSTMHQGALENLTPLVYDDVDTRLHPVARYSLWAHLLKLEREGRVVAEGDNWIFRT